MADLNYDVDKLPLGKLSKGTITRGYQALKDLSVLMNDPSLAQSQYGTSYNEAVEQLSNGYFSTIPHNFGRSGRLPVIQDQARLNKVRFPQRFGHFPHQANADSPPGGRTSR